MEPNFSVSNLGYFDSVFSSRLNLPSSSLREQARRGGWPAHTGLREAGGHDAIIRDGPGLRACCPAASNSDPNQPEPGFLPPGSAHFCAVGSGWAAAVLDRDAAALCGPVQARAPGPVWAA